MNGLRPIGGLSGVYGLRHNVSRFHQMPLRRGCSPAAYAHTDGLTLDRSQRGYQPRRWIEQPPPKRKVASSTLAWGTQAQRRLPHRKPALTCGYLFDRPVVTRPALVTVAVSEHVRGHGWHNFPRIPPGFAREPAAEAPTHSCTLFGNARCRIPPVLCCSPPTRDRGCATPRR